MAKLTVPAILTLFTLLITATQISAGPDEEAESLFQNILNGNIKLVKLQFYVQDVLGGPNATVYDVARASITNDSASSFGLVRAVDDLVTAGPDRSTEALGRALGRAQGLIAYTDLETPALAMNLNIHFTAGEYNGSTISVVGRSQFSDAVRETAVAGGTGAFRFARGYSLSTIYSFDAEANYAVIETTIYTIVVDSSSATVEQRSEL